MKSTGQSELPVGVIPPYQWAERSIPISGEGDRGTEVIDLAVTKAMHLHGIVGCGVCVCKGDAVIYSKGFGFAELPSKPFLPTTASRCGSLAKQITAISALMLMDRGVLDLDSRVMSILKSAGINPHPVDNRVWDITVRELMDHTSGLTSGATYTSWRPGRNLIADLKLDRKPTATDVVTDALNTAQLGSDPGQTFEYANANFVILARVIEARSGMKFADYLQRVVTQKFGLSKDDIFVSRDQASPADPARRANEAAYYQTSNERYCSFLPQDAASGQVFGEAYKGYSTECADGAGGIAVSAEAIGKILANLRSPQTVLSQKALREILTPPNHYLTEPGFDKTSSQFYSKGFNVRFAEGTPWLSHSGMTNHCGGMIGYNADYQFVIVSNWNSPQSPYVDSILNQAVAKAVAKMH